MAEGRFDDARGLLADAEKIGAAQPAQVRLVRAQNEMFAGRFADAAEQYGKLLQATPADPMLLCQAAVACGADGLLVECHPDPSAALTDGAQSLTPAALAELLPRLRRLAEALGRTM